MSTLLSFDVFDTLLTRAVGRPGDAFLLLGRRLWHRSLIPCSPEVFAKMRSEAEGQAFANAGGLDSEVNLEQIYAELAMALGMDEAGRAELVAEELRLEAELLRPIAPMVHRLERERAGGARIAYVSDMYLPSPVIKQLLTDKGVALAGEPCYVSNEHARSKESGQLYTTLLEQERIGAGDVVHVGNNSRADVLGARRAGLRAEPFPAGNLNRYEEALSQFAFSTEGLAAAFAGASRLARLSIPAETDQALALRDVSAGVAAPLIVGFTLWALREASRLGLKRLYFVARDGQILHTIARQLAPRLGLDLDLRYLYGSRQAWILPGLNSADEEQLGRIFKSYDFFSVDHLTIEGALSRVEVTPHEFAEPLARAGFHEADWRRPLRHAERQALRDLLLHDSAVGELIMRRAAAARELSLGYLRQEGMFENVPWALVDLGTGATLHRALSHLLEQAAGPPVTSLYLGYTGGRADLPGRLLTYYFDLPSRLGMNEVPGLVTMIEMICSADHGTVLGYKSDAGGIRPALKEERNSAVLDWGYDLVRNTVSRFADELLLDSELVSPWADLRRAIAATLTLFWLSPTGAEAEAWGGFPFEDGWGQASYILRLGPPFRWRDLAHIVAQKDVRHHRHTWKHGSLQRTPPVLRHLLHGLLLTKRLIKSETAQAGLRRLGQGPRWLSQSHQRSA